MENGSRIAELARGLTCRDGVIALVSSLGLRVSVRVLEDGPAVGSASPDIVGVHVVAERAGIRVVLVEIAGDVSARDVTDVAQRFRRADGVRRTLLFLAADGYTRVVVAAPPVDGVVHQLVIEPSSIRVSDVETLEEMVAREGEGAAALVLRWTRALDRSRVTRRFFIDFRAQRSRVSGAWLGLPIDARADRDQLSLLFLCRLMFLYFLQRHGHLAGDSAWLVGRFRQWRSRRRSGRTFFRAVLDALFFGALNTRPAQRSAAARRLGALPYLNGGLFERTAVERRWSDLDLPDAVVAGVFDNLLEKYRFTTDDRTEDVVGGASAVGVDPEMLGRVFEGMMSSDRRGDTGTYFTPAPAVDHLVRTTVAAHLSARLGLPSWMTEEMLIAGDASPLDDDQRARAARELSAIRILDPACGSGAFLLGALSRIAPLRSSLDRSSLADAKRDIVARSLHGVDMQSDAALLCALRLWLALSLPAAANVTLPPLPNLDRRVRQGDALLDPLDLAGGADPLSAEWLAARDPDVRRHAAALAPLGVHYVATEPGEREVVTAGLRSLEVSLARAWLHAIGRRLEHRVADLRARTAHRDLWGERTAEAVEANTKMPRAAQDLDEISRLVHSIDESGALPFFSFGIHFPDSTLRGFDVILANPPWLRAHRWPAPLRRMLRSRFRVCREGGWRLGARLAHAPAAAGAQVDLSLLFLEKSVSLLADRGALGMLLPAKVLRSMYGASARRMLLADTSLIAIDDHSLHQHSIFQADAFAASIVAVRRTPVEHESARLSGPAAANVNGSPRTADAHGTTGAVRITLHRRRGEPLRFALPADRLPLVLDDPASPWLLAPPRVHDVIRRMQQRGGPLGEHLRVRRGVFTGANDVLIVREVVPRLGGLASIRAHGWQGASNARATAARSVMSARNAIRSAHGGNGTAAAVASLPEQEPDSQPAVAYEAIVEADCLRPLVCGSDVTAWMRRESRWVIWLHGEDGRPRTPPPRLAGYLARHGTRLDARSGLRRGAAIGSIFRVSREAMGHKVVWHDLAETLKAVVVPAIARSTLGLLQPVIPLNTTYFIGVPAENDALVLAALLNSIPLRCFARTIAERAKDARFRFFAWVIGVLPLADGWRDASTARQLSDIAREAHANEAIDADAQARLDALVARMYGLDSKDLDALAGFDAWLSGGRMIP
jgi:Eco57I restriction-modification methylase